MMAENLNMKSLQELLKAAKIQQSQRELTELGKYRLEQCGKNWRVKKILYPSDEIKTDWLTYKEADALLKIFKSGEEHGE